MLVTFPFIVNAEDKESVLRLTSSVILWESKYSSVMLNKLILQWMPIIYC